MKRRFEEGDVYFDALTQSWLEGTRRVFHELPPLEW
jgi:putative proteasome-type protease